MRRTVAKKKDKTEETQELDGFDYYDEDEIALTMEDMLMTLFINPPAASRRRVLLRKHEQKHRRGQESLDHKELGFLIKEHLLFEFRRSLGGEDYVLDADIEVTQVQTKLLNHSSVTLDTVVVSGQIYFSSKLGIPREAAIHQMVRFAFAGEALERFLDLLHDESNDAVLQRTYQVHVGLPSDYSDLDAFFDPNNMDTFNTVPGAEGYGNDSPPFKWIAIAAGGSVVFVCLCVLLCYFVVRRRRNNQLKAQIKSKLAAGSDNTKQSGETQNTMSKSQAFIDEGICANRGDFNLQNSFTQEQGSLSSFGDYQPSEETSVYSYCAQNYKIELEDNDNSLAPSYMYGSSPDRGELHDTGMWSVADGLNDYSTIDFSKANNSGDQRNQVGVPLHSPSRMVITTGHGFVPDDCGEQSDLDLESDSRESSPMRTRKEQVVPSPRKATSQENENSSRLTHDDGTDNTSKANSMHASDAKSLQSEDSNVIVRQVRQNVDAARRLLADDVNDENNDDSLLHGTEEKHKEHTSTVKEQALPPSPAHPEDEVGF